MQVLGRAVSNWLIETERRGFKDGDRMRPGTRAPVAAQRGQTPPAPPSKVVSARLDEGAYPTDAPSHTAPRAKTPTPGASTWHSPPEKIYPCRPDPTPGVAERAVASLARRRPIQ